MGLFLQHLEIPKISKNSELQFKMFSVDILEGCLFALLPHVRRWDCASWVWNQSQHALAQKQQTSWIAVCCRSIIVTKFKHCNCIILIAIQYFWLALLDTLFWKRKLCETTVAVTWQQTVHITCGQTPRRDGTLQWPRSDGWNPPVWHTHPTRSIAPMTTAPLVTGWRTSRREGLRMEDRARRGGLIYEPESR